MDQKINIGLFIDVYYPTIDGVVKVVDNYATILSKTANVTVFAPDVIGKTFVDDFPYKVVRCKTFKVPFIAYDIPTPNFDKKFKTILKQTNLDVVHIHSPFGVGKLGVKYAKKHKIPLIATMHSQFKKDFYRTTNSKSLTKMLLKDIMRVFNACDECWAVNSEIGNVFKGYGYKKEPLVFNNGTDFKLIKNKQKTNKIVNIKFNIKDEDIVFLFVGRLTALKNIFFIIDSLKIVQSKGYNFKMLFVGCGPDENQLREEIHKANLDDNVVMCGKITDRDLMCAIYARAYLFLFPSLYDSSSLVQIEAASQKTPSIFLEGAVTAATIEKDKNGFIVANNKTAFAEKIIEILNNKDYHTKIAEGAYKDLYLSWDTAVKKAEERYNELIKIKNSSWQK